MNRPYLQSRSGGTGHSRKVHREYFFHFRVLHIIWLMFFSKENNRSMTITLSFVCPLHVPKSYDKGQDYKTR